MRKTRSSIVGIFLLLLSHSASSLADDAWEDARLLTAEESGFAIAEVCGTTIIEKRLTKGEDIRLFPTLFLGLELSAVHTVDATTTAFYTTVETTTFMVPTGTPPLHDHESWLLTTPVYTQMAGPQGVVIYKQPILTLGVGVPRFRDSSAVPSTSVPTPSVSIPQTPGFKGLFVPTTVSPRVSELLDSQLTR